MEKVKHYSCLKLYPGFFDEMHIKRLLKAPQGCVMVIIYLKALLATIRSDGCFIWTGLEPSLAEELALTLDEPVRYVKALLELLKTCGIAEMPDEQTLFLPDAVKLRG